MCQGAMHQWLKEEECSLPVGFIAHQDGSPTDTVRKMDAPVCAAWGPINRKYAEAVEPCLEVVLAKYNHPRKAPVPMSSITQECLCKHLSRIGPSPMGLDAWSLQDLWAP